ncbi:hypothetical protein [Desulfurococcus amylolyticus]|nr:hypothetical protein [Desulfurococcus amylolyticus]
MKNVIACVKSIHEALKMCGPWGARERLQARYKPKRDTGEQG